MLTLTSDKRLSRDYLNSEDIRKKSTDQITSLALSLQLQEAVRLSEQVLYSYKHTYITYIHTYMHAYIHIYIHLYLHIFTYFKIYLTIYFTYLFAYFTIYLFIYLFSYLTPLLPRNLPTAPKTSGNHPLKNLIL